MPEIDDVVHTYVAAWHEVDEQARRELLQMAWSDEGIYQDPKSDIAGREQLMANISEFQQRFPGCTFKLPSGIDHHHGHFHFAWKLLAPDGKTKLTGRDFGTTDKAGRILRITGFFDAPQPGF